MPFEPYLQTYVDELAQCVKHLEVTCGHGGSLNINSAFADIRAAFEQAHQNEGRLLFVGNGGSAAIASHQAFDYWKNGKLRASAFNDSSLLTGGGNDFGYERAFEKTLEMHAFKRDVVIAISSSGQSPNILNAAKQARAIGCFTVTLSAFKTDNPLRRLGDVNIYLRTDRYGHAELGHECILHTILDEIIDSRTISEKTT